uniref:(California timema) hypothetical protein n=1 Tax=Timema californicum TaxID=61474 RepID=A0A7R9J208_TIMCA|nr:unnamed protein product [Timema californicum]
MLLTQFVCGVRNNAVKQSLLAREDDLALGETINIACISSDVTAGERVEGELLGRKCHIYSWSRVKHADTNLPPRNLLSNRRQWLDKVCVRGAGGGERVGSRASIENDVINSSPGGGGATPLSRAESGWEGGLSVAVLVSQ